MIAIVSDIHGNLEALQAVLADIAQHGVEAIYCLGDIVGYGPNPRECVDAARDFRVAILGNHDQGALFDPEGFCGPAERAIFWTRGQLESSPEPRHVRERRWELLAELPRTHRENGCQFVHGSARSPLNEYVFPDDVYNQQKIRRVFAAVERTCFQGHTHVPGVFQEEGSANVFTFRRPDEVNGAYRLDGRKALINVGSVGQPRDGDPRACYVLFDGALVRFRRVEYDVGTTASKILAVGELDRVLAERLRRGQ
jgi:diadenosine tetraphosphatase ApaH/serine/threonine PP2A family protein phosphatase